MIRVLADDLAARRSAIGRSASLQALAARLRAALEPVLHGEPYLPEQKPLLSRDGGVCARDCARLAFDPLSPQRHRCPQCGRRYSGGRHHLAWIWRYHLWLSERAIHLGLLSALGGEPRLAERAHDVLVQYAALYPTVPNRDNVLGPARLFFSTYLESIWLAQIAIAALLLEARPADGGQRTARAALRPMVAESAALIASFDEGLSNRQVWNTTALLAAALWLEDDTLRRRAAERVRQLLAEGVTGEGMWHEGENYHFFALRGLLLAAELLRWGGADLYGDGRSGDALAAMYLAPLETLLPDLTLPARGDAPYGVSICQPRFVETWEVGWARTGAPRLEHLLTELYASELPDTADAGIADIAEQDLNRPPARLARERLGWKALLWMRPEGPQRRGTWRGGSVLLDGAGLAVLRPDGQTYASLECGGAASGHAHPDALHLTLYLDGPRLMDFGTGSYVAPSLHWYRSTLAHNAPGLAGAGQLVRDAWCAAFEARDAWCWCQGVARNPFGPRTEATRSVVLGPDYLLDVLDVEAPSGTRIDLPLHPVGGAVALGKTTPARLVNGIAAAGHEHGYDLVSVVRAVEPGAVSLGGALMGGREGESLFLATAPGPPTIWLGDAAPLTFMVRRAAGRGRWVHVFPRADAVAGVDVRGDEVVVRLVDGGRERFTVAPGRLTLVDREGRRRSLAGGRVPPVRPPPPVAVRRQRATLRCPRLDAPPPLGEWEHTLPAEAVRQLDRRHYRRSSAAFGEEGPFGARVGVFALKNRVGFAVRVTKSRLTYRRSGTADPALDNEPPDIHSDGVQCYVDADGWRGFVLVPQDARRGSVAVRAVAGTAGRAEDVDAVWAPAPEGYALVATVRVPRTIEPGDRIGVNLVVNEMYPDRRRRAGQLVLSGDAGWVYLRGDRESPAAAVIVEVV